MYVYTHIHTLTPYITYYVIYYIVYCMICPAHVRLTTHNFAHSPCPQVRLGKGQMGAALTGSLTSYSFDRGTFGYSRYPTCVFPNVPGRTFFSNLQNKRYFCSGPTSVDPICPQPNATTTTTTTTINDNHTKNTTTTTNDNDITNNDNSILTTRKSLLRLEPRARRQTSEAYTRGI